MAINCSSRLALRQVARITARSPALRRNISITTYIPTYLLRQEQTHTCSTTKANPLPRRHFSSTSRRAIFIQTQDTPNPDALKFVPNHRILPENIGTTFLEYLSPRSTLAPPHPSPLAAQLHNIDGVSSVFYGPDYITVTKSADANWAHIKPEIFALITETISSGASIVNAVEGDSHGQQGGITDSLEYDENDSEVVSMIKELLETRIRPAIQEDGGDIEYRGFEGGNVKLKLRGACRTCDSSTVTLKNGIESMLMHYIEEVKGVIQVLDEEEEVALKEFALFEEKLRAQKRSADVASTITQGSSSSAV